MLGKTLSFKWFDVMVHSMINDIMMHLALRDSQCSPAKEWFASGDMVIADLLFYFKFDIFYMFGEE